MLLSTSPVGTRIAGLRTVVNDEQQFAVLRVLVDRRRSLDEDHTRMTSRCPATAPPSARSPSWHSTPTTRPAPTPRRWPATRRRRTPPATGSTSPAARGPSAGGGPCRSSRWPSTPGLSTPGPSVSQLHQLLELVPGGARKDLEAAQAKVLLAKVRPRRRRRSPASGRCPADRGPRACLRPQQGSRQGVARAGRRNRHHVGGLARHRPLRCGPTAGRGRRHHPFPDRDHFASWNGTAPLDASSGDQVLHRLYRKGNRQINWVLHIMATVQLRNPTEGRAYFDRRRAESKTSMEAMRALKRRLSNFVHQRMLDDAPHGARRARGGNGATGQRLRFRGGRLTTRTPALRTSHSRKGHQPAKARTPQGVLTERSATSDQPSPGPVTTTLGPQPPLGRVPTDKALEPAP